MVGSGGGAPIDFHDRSRAEGFGSDPLSYDRYRPGYPGELVEWLSVDGIGRALDVGCGTGQVARLLVAAGWDVVGIEPDERMAEVARSHGLQVAVGRFEEWHGSAIHDLVCCGQAWHWIDPDVGYERAAAALQSGGRLAFFWNFYEYDAQTRHAIRVVFDHHAPGLWSNSVHLGNAIPHDVVPKDDIRSGLADSFEEPQWSVFTHRRRLVVDDWLAEAGTHSAIAKLDPDRRQALFTDLRLRLAKLGDVVEVKHETRVTSARRL